MGRFSFFEIQGMQKSSAWEVMILGPKPPPVKAVMTCTWLSDSPRLAAMVLRSGIGAWLLAQMVMLWLRLSQLAMKARFSMAPEAPRSTWNFRLTTTSALAADSA